MKPSNNNSAISRAASRLRGGIVLVFRSHRHTLPDSDKPTQAFELAVILIFSVIFAAIAFLTYTQLHQHH